ncbi:unnamed protein product [Psylliodes chrysocephalus]|uniref:Uncharacterized protein n=1 Tax=Psylliodes chrysocephalus TaxID=3402493 RepID=A0A9P0CQF3_9CUCU|nr:unnamed protein product [Psylliodes chrysocephala]
MKSYFDVFDWKKAVETHVKPPSQWHFQFSSAKRIIIKKEASLSEKKLITAPIWECTINPVKLNDVDNLLKKHFGADWRNVCGVDLTFYQRIIDSNNDNQLKAPDEDTTLPNVEENRI